MWAWQTFGPEIAVTSSFQSQSVPLLHMISTTTPDMPVLFLDTGFHFPETLAFRDSLIRDWGLRVRSLTADPGNEHAGRMHGQLHQTDPDLCCYINKVVPLAEARKELRAWITGIRRDQTEARRDTPVVSLNRVVSSRFAHWPHGQTGTSGNTSAGTIYRHIP